MDGVIVSNHGGRQVDGAIAALDALPAVVDAVGSEAVLFDSGIRSGADVVKALALGADAVLLGRPYLWGLALDGRAGCRDRPADAPRRARSHARAERLRDPGPARPSRPLPRSAACLRRGRRSSHAASVRRSQTVAGSRARARSR